LRSATQKTSGELEAEISQAVIRFEKEFMGRGPLETKTYVLDDLVVIRLKGVLTQAEMKLAETGNGQRGRYLLKQVRQELIDHARPMLECIIRDILGVEVSSLHTDISTKTGERVIVLSLTDKPATALTARGSGATNRERAEQRCSASKTM
jgi:uncharacterized protein YbcI